MKNSQLTPSKRTPKSRGLRQQDWTSLNYSQQYEVLHNVAFRRFSHGDQSFPSFRSVEKCYWLGRNYRNW